MEVKRVLTNEVDFECGAANEKEEFFAAILALIKQIENNANDGDTGG